MTEFEQGSTNVYADLGCANAEEMLIKAQLAGKIAETVKRRRLTQTEAAAILGLPPPKLSALLRGHLRRISKARLLSHLMRLGQGVGQELASGYVAMAANETREAEAEAWTEALLPDVANDRTSPTNRRTGADQPAPTCCLHLAILPHHPHDANCRKA